MKNSVVKIIIALVFLVVFNVIFFICDIPHSDANWYSYGFITFAYLCLLATPLLAKGSSSAILSGSLWLRAIFYFFTELIVGIGFILANPESYKWALIVQSVLLAIFIILQLMSVLSNDATTNALDTQFSESFARQTLIDKLQTEARGITDPTVKPVVNRCLDALLNTPIQTFPGATDADLALNNAVYNLCSEIKKGDTEQIKYASDRMLSALQNRNLVIKRCRML